jgi:uncharacterized protein with von Willebrand factor type A (vWA) domain
MGHLRGDHPLWSLFHQLRRRGVPLGPDDMMAMHRVLRAGFGWTSRSALRGVCRALWAKSRDEEAMLDSLFDQIVTDDWAAPVADPVDDRSDRIPRLPPEEQKSKDAKPERPSQPPVPEPQVPAEVKPPGRLPAISMDGRHLSLRPFVLVPQYPMTLREVAQAWRRLRRPSRFGPATELDLGATVARRVQTGVATPPVLTPRRRNTARALLLIDRDGSMAPFHDFVGMVSRVIGQTAQLADADTLYFHDLPAEGGNDFAIALLPEGSLFPTIDSVMRHIRPATEGMLYRDAAFSEPTSWAEVLRRYGGSHAVVLISDAGAARGRYDPRRAIESVALARALNEAGSSVVWLNPVPRERWRHTTAEELARHVTMFPLDRQGTQRAVMVLRSQRRAPRRHG